MKILGIDPGFADTGYGVVLRNGSKLNCLDYGSIKTSKTLSLSERIEKLEKDLQQIITKHHPDQASVEQLFFCTNIKTAISVAQARGVILLTLVKNKIPLIECTPLQVKQAVTGYGKADKKQIQQMVKIILGLKEIPKPDDAADALAMAICGANNLRANN
ncbi:MAG: crossover junction endodeoxyribonuclease RuvC [Patescibacteria group bacterium]